MDIVLHIVSGIAGIAMLYYGAEFLIKGGVSIALKLKVSALIIGLTLVAFGTSFPELVVSVNAAFHNSGDICIGNVVGSNICNIALILGLCALICPMPVHKQLLKFDVWLMLGSAALFVLFYGISGGINQIEAGILLAILIAYTVGSFWIGRKAEVEKSAEEKEDRY